MKLCPCCTDANPLQCIWVDPNKIEFYYRGEPRRFGILKGGDWDLNGVRFEETDFYQFVYQRYVGEADWHETELYQQWKKEIVDDVPNRKFETLNELKSYVDSIDELYHRIDQQGYRSQAKLFDENPSQAWKSNNDALHPLLNEVAINIGRDGRMGKKSSGKHRLAIAKLLDVDRIPVVVRARHQQWQNIRNQIKRGKSTNPTNSSKISNHPDLELLD